MGGLEKLVKSEAGLTPLKTLCAATSDPVRLVGMAGEFGWVAPGLRADLVLVASNPLGDAARIRDLSGVMVRGRWLSRGTLEQTVANITASYALQP